MNFPDSLLVEIIYAIINHSGLGGVVIAILATSLVLIFGLTLRWVTHDDSQNTELYAYPTAALHLTHHQENGHR